MGRCLFSLARFASALSVSDLLWKEFVADSTMVAIAAEETPNVTDVTTAVATIELDERKLSTRSQEREEEELETEETEREEENVNAGQKYASWSSTLIGEGAFGSVLLVVNDEGRKLAVKTIPVKDSAVKQTIEYDFMQELKGHVNVVQPYGMELQGTDVIHISMEYVCYDLFYLIDYLNHGNIRHFFRHLMEGIRHIHSKGIAHRDIKPENLLINEHFVLKITDFGLAERFRDQENNELLLNGRAGSSPYISPEGRGKVDFHAEPHDIFACGVVLLFLLTKNTHWEKADPIEDLRYKKFVSGAMYQEKSWKVIQGNVITVIKKVLKDNPNKRANVDEILRCGWLTEEEERLNWDKLRNGVLKVYATPVPNEKCKKEEQENRHEFKHNLNNHNRKLKKKGKR